ncbi:hypothetical protein PGB90_003706 [Kerria lacca]
MKDVERIYLTDVIMEDSVLKFEEEEDLSDFFLKKAIEELRETETIKINSLNELKHLISKEKDLYIPFNDETEKYMLAYLRSCKFHVNSAFKKMTCLYICRLNYPQYFAHISPLNEKNMLVKNMFTILPQRDQHGRRVLITRIEKWRTSECTLTEVVRGTLLLAQAAMREPKTQICGITLINDMKGLGFQHVWQITPSFVKMILEWTQDLLPIRVKEIHFVFQTYIFKTVYAIFKPFLKEKLRNRIFLHGYDMSSLPKHIDAKYLPIEYGGLLNFPLDQGLNQFSFFYKFNDEYERTDQHGYTNKQENVKK